MEKNGEDNERYTKFFTAICLLGFLAMLVGGFIFVPTSIEEGKEQINECLEMEENIEDTVDYLLWEKKCDLVGSEEYIEVVIVLQWVMACIIIMAILLLIYWATLRHSPHYW